MKYLQTRRDRTILGVLLALILALLFIIFGMGDDEDSREDVTITPESRPAVTILVVDDFNDALREKITASLPAEGYELVAEEIRNIDPQQSDHQEAIDQILSQYLIADGQLYEDALEATRAVIGEDLGDNNCIVTPEGQSVFTTGGTSVFTTGGTSVFTTGGTEETGASDIPHGERVYALLEELVSQQGGSADIRLERVDTGDFRTQTIATNLQATIDRIQTEDPTMNFVVNMSFAVVPCMAVPTLAEYQRLMEQFATEDEANLAWLQQIFRHLIQSNTMRQPVVANDFFEQYFGKVCPARGEDPSGENAFSCQQDASQIIFVGAAGNGTYVDELNAQIGPDFPYYPAAWPEVVSVSASDQEEDFLAVAPKASYSNSGVVLMPGTWTSAGEPQRGTSFAAPRYSFLMAMNLAGAGIDVCRNGDLIEPALPNIWIPNPPAVTNDPLC